MIRKRTKIYGILGSSLDHSLSAMIFNFLFNRYGLDASYTTFEIYSGALSKAIAGIRTLGISGINVTYPYKQSVIKYLNKLDASASAASAVNVIKNRDGTLTGYNSDIFGIEKSLTNVLRINPKNKYVCLIGAGGAARACLSVLVKYSPAGITILNRTEANAKRLARDFEIISDIRRSSIEELHESDQLHGYAFDVVINASSANPKATAMILRKLNKMNCLQSASYFDLNYGTRAVMKNLPNGICQSTDGLYMLAAQAAKNFRIWFNRDADIEEIHELLIQNTRGEK